MKVVDFILCDDIRHELANKISIIGAYNDRIEFISRNGQEPKWPINMRLGLYCRLAVEENDQHFDALELTLHLKGEEIINFKVAIPKDSDLSKPLALAFPIPGVNIKGTGELIPTFKVLNGKNVVQKINPDIKFQITVRSS